MASDTIRRIDERSIDSFSDETSRCLLRKRMHWHWTYLCFEKCSQVCWCTVLNSLNSNTFRWSAAKGSRQRGDPELQLLLARTYRDIEDYAGASKHYLHTEQPIEFAQMLSKWSETGFESERDLYLTRAVLQYVWYPNTRCRDGLTVFLDCWVSRTWETPMLCLTSLQTQTKSSTRLWSISCVFCSWR